MKMPLASEHATVLHHASQILALDESEERAGGSREWYPVVSSGIKWHHAEEG